MANEPKQITTPHRVAAKPDPEYVIESHIPLPAGARKPKYPFHQMKEGQSFAIHKDEKSRCSSAASSYGRANGVRFFIRQYGGILRCWHAGKREPTD